MEQESKVISLYQQKNPLQTDNNNTKQLPSKTLKLLGHQGCVNACRFSKCGDYLASAGHDKSILIWDIFDTQCKNLGSLKGHGNSILELVWDQDTTVMYSASADKSAIVWDVSTGQKIRKLKVHQDIVNSVDVMAASSSLLVTASDDYTVVLWDLRTSDTIIELDINFPVTSVCFGKSSSQMLVYFGGLDNTIKAYNLKANQLEYELKGHHDTISGLSVSKSGKYLLSNAMDQTLKVWDIQPYVQGGNSERCIKTMLGAKHNYQKNLLRCDWSCDDQLITAGSADGMLNIWQFESGELLTKLGGHNASLNQASFHPKLKNIVASASTDRTINLGEFEFN